MKWTSYCICAGILLSLMLLGSGCSSERLLLRPYVAEKMIHYSELKKVDSDRNLNNWVIYINEGETIPLKISLESDFMEFKQEHVDVVAKEKLYFMIKMPENLTSEELKKLNEMGVDGLSEMSERDRMNFFKHYMLYVSKDARSWAALNDNKACRKALGFSAGTISFGISASTRDGLGAGLKIQTIK